MPEVPLIIRGGLVVSPGEVEQVLLSHPAVTEAAVVGVPDRLLGETVGAAVRLSAPLPSAPAGLARHCRGFIAEYKVPERWLFMSALPRTPDGEVARTTVAAQLAVTIAPSGAGRDLIDLADLFRPRPAIEDLRVPHQVRRSWALEDL